MAKAMKPERLSNKLNFYFMSTINIKGIAEAVPVLPENHKTFMVGGQYMVAHIDGENITTSRHSENAIGVLFYYIDSPNGEQEVGFKGNRKFDSIIAAHAV